MIPDIRTGHGIDTHALTDGEKIKLCGIEISHNKKLLGHSDADVGLHALCDALLACIALGDIGTHFPPSDEKWKNKDSSYFVKFALEKIKQQGGIVNHCDITFICQQPNISQHREKMQKHLSDILEISTDRISIKATTNEKLGFIGRNEGITAMATATVIMK